MATTDQKPNRYIQADCLGCGWDGPKHRYHSSHSESAQRAFKKTDRDIRRHKAESGGHPVATYQDNLQPRRS